MRIIPLTLLLLALALPAQAGSRRGTALPELAERVEATLARHVEGEAISAWLGTLPAESLEREAAEWILAWLPEPDLVALDLELLREHVAWSARVYREAPWRDQMDRELWRNFVVPHRVSQEPAQAWRARFHREIWPRVENAESMELAALEVNRWCREQATFRSTSGRDMGPLTTIERGLGRCEEEMILSISALRSVGLPARSCATPYWTFTDNNHAWVETWADGRWYYLGACEPGACLNDAWFTGAARRAGFVRSVAYGELDPGGEPLYRSEKGSTLVNSTAVYTDPFRLRADLAEGLATEEDARIHVNVLNFGNLRAIASIEPGDEIALGPGEYALTAASGDDLLLRVVGGAPGDLVEATLGESDVYDLAESRPFWLRYPEAYTAARRDLALVDDEVRALSDLRVRAKDASREKLRAPNESEREMLAALGESERERFTAALEKPIGDVSTLFLLLAHYDEPAERAALIAFVEMADDKDLLELGEPEIRSHVDGALSVRGRLEPVGISVPDSLFEDSVLRCRIDREPGSAWRDGLPLVPLAGGARASLDAVLERFADLTEERERGFFGPPLDPAQCLRIGGGDERDLGIALVGLLRRNGFPARRRHDRVEVWLGEWLRLNPVNATLADEAGEEAGGTGRLHIEITRGGLPYPQAESYRHFNLGRIEGGKIVNPWWDPRVGEQEWDAGEFVLCTVLRVPGGSACGRLRAFTVPGGGSAVVSLPASAAGDGWDAGEALFSGPDPEAVLAALPEAPPGDVLLFAFVPGEPAERMLAALGRLRPRLESLKIPFLPLLVGEGDANRWSDIAAAAGWTGGVDRDPAGALIALGEGGTMEPLLLLLRDGEPRLLRQGFDASADGTVHLALDILE